MSNQSNEQQGIPSIALAAMAMQVAGACPPEDDDIQYWFSVWKPVPRAAVALAPDDYDYSGKYYRLIDEIASNNASAFRMLPTSGWLFKYDMSALKDVAP